MADEGVVLTIIK